MSATDIPPQPPIFEVMKVKISYSGKRLVFQNRDKTFLKVLDQAPQMMAKLRGRQHAYFEIGNDRNKEELHIGSEVEGLDW